MQESRKDVRQARKQTAICRKLLSGQQCLPDTLRMVSKCRCAHRCPIDISHSTAVLTTLGRPSWCPEMASGLNASLRQVPLLSLSLWLLLCTQGRTPEWLLRLKKTLYTEGHTPAGKSWCLRVTNQPLGIDQALLCAGPWSGC